MESQPPTPGSLTQNFFIVLPNTGAVTDVTAGAQAETVSERTQQIKDTIRNHLATVGATRWKAVRLQCPEISEATFWRYVKAVREELEKEAVPKESPAPTNKHHPDGGVPRLGALPAFYNPLGKARQYESLLADVEIIRSRSLDYRGRVTNMRMLERSILLRERLLRQQAEVMDYFQNQEVMRQFFGGPPGPFCTERKGFGHAE
jgi:hypothetical protein